MPTITLKLPTLLDWQKEVARDAARFNVLSIGRRAGKTMFGQDRLAQAEVIQLPSAWFSPTYKYMIEVWREISQRFAPIISRQNASERRMEFVTGGVLEFWTLENDRAGMGRKYRRVIIDEAAFVPNLLDIWNHSIRPTLADYIGDAFILSTPKGRNGFWQMWHYGQDPGQEEWASWRMPSEVNPRIDRDELEAMRRHLPERVARQELDAEFLDDAGGVFRRVIEAATAVELERPLSGHHYIAGVDVASQVDFTVVCVLDAAAKEMVYMDRFNRVEYPTLEGRLAATYHRFDLQTMIVESNSIGRPVIDHLRQRGLSIQEFVTTSMTKTPLIQNLQAAFEHGSIKIINDPVLISELQAFEGKQMSTHWQYSAPEGMHDDTVMSLAIAWSGISKGMGIYV